MKLYTEKQVVNAIQITVMDKPITYAEVLEKLTPIQLPSDEEIGKDIGSGMHDYYKEGFIAGAKWVIEQIKQQVPTRSLADDVQSVVFENNKTDKITDVVKLVKDMRDAGLLSTPAYTLPMVDTIGKIKQKDKCFSCGIEKGYYALYCEFCRQ